MSRVALLFSLLACCFALQCDRLMGEERNFPPPRMNPLPTDLAPLEYVDVGAKIPNYIPSDKWGTQGEPLRLMQKPLPPSESLRHISVPEGFHVDLFVAEPDLGGKPICMAWDIRGRLWVGETVDYPNELSVEGAGRDRIRICEDTDGDRRADKFIVFADGLSIPTSIAFAGGGAIVHNGTQTLFLQDTDGDDRADVRQVLLKGWAMGDTHGGPSNMQYGLDNWIWGMQGYNQSTVTSGNRTITFAQGFHRFRPDGSKLEFIRSTDNNTWGLGISEEGILFGSTANHNPSVYMPVPNRYYERVRGWKPQLRLGTIADSHRFQPITEKVRQVDHHGGYTAGAGHAIYTARTYPPQYWNQTAFVCGPTGHLVGTFVLSPDGAGFRSTSPGNLLASDDEWTAPIMAEVGPDGNVWVIDWYNFIVQHNPTPEGFKTGKGHAYETELRDKKHGRIYRVVYGKSTGDSFSLAGATPEELVRALAHPNMFWRRHAQRLLVERGEHDVVPSLLELLRDRSIDRVGLNVGAIHALWTLHGLGAIHSDASEVRRVVYDTLQHPSAGVRRNAVQVLPHAEQTVAELMNRDLLDDDDPQVRLMTLLALADLPRDSFAGEKIAQMLLRPENARDRWIRDGATSAAAMHGGPFLRAALRSWEEPSDHLIDVTRIVSEHVARSDQDDLNHILGPLADADLGLAVAVLKGLDAGWPEQRRVSLDRQAEQSLQRLSEHLPLEQQGDLVRLALRWGSEALSQRQTELSEMLLTSVADRALADERRIEAGERFVSFRAGDPDAAQALLAEVTPQTPPALASGLLQALRHSRAPQTGQLVVQRMTGLAPSSREVAIDLLLSRGDWTRSLLAALEKGEVPVGELTLLQRQSLASHPDREVRVRSEELLRSGGTLPDEDRQQVLEQLAWVAQEDGNAAEGKRVFKEHCAKCHVYRGEGTKVGPDLTGMAVHPKSELLVHILDPSRSVEGNFRQYTIQQVDGRIVAGMLAGESATVVEVIDAEGKRHAVLREEIEELIASTKSMMPEGFEKQLKPVDLVNLLELLTSRDRYIPIDLRKFATVSSAHGMFTRPESRRERLLLEDWSVKTHNDVPFLLVDPQEGRVANVIMLHGPHAARPPQMPRSVRLPCRTSAKAIHLLSGIGGWAYPYGQKGTLSMIVRIHYSDGAMEDHPLANGLHFADYIRRIDVPESEFAFSAGGRQIRYLQIRPERQETIEQIELIKGEDDTAPLVVAVTVEAG